MRPLRVEEAVIDALSCEPLVESILVSGSDAVLRVYSIVAEDTDESLDRIYERESHLMTTSPCCFCAARASVACHGREYCPDCAVKIFSTAVKEDLEEDEPPPDEETVRKLWDVIRHAKGFPAVQFGAFWGEADATWQSRDRVVRVIASPSTVVIYRKSDGAPGKLLKASPGNLKRALAWLLNATAPVP